ncbi:MAG: hypothetical protein F6K42_31665 [Leptolyngbya sp. SIO1D8]|nr:hypothetical protein [Leptolyngbya sp. SIO1D8]
MKVVPPDFHPCMDDSGFRIQNSIEEALENIAILFGLRKEFSMKNPFLKVFFIPTMIWDSYTAWRN